MNITFILPVMVMLCNLCRRALGLYLWVVKHKLEAGSVRLPGAVSGAVDPGVNPGLFGGV